MDALIGYSGFVGSQLLRQHSFGATFNSANIADIGASTFDTVVCAAAPGSMFEANRRPESDLAKVNALIEHLATIQAKQVVLISSIAVLSDFASKDDESTTSFQTTLAYGKHRRLLEAFCEELFDRCLIVRLPSLFGTGLRKNFIFDLLNPIPTLLTIERYNALRKELNPAKAEFLDQIYHPDPASGMLRVDRKLLAQSKHKAALEKTLSELNFSATHFHNHDSTYQYYDMERLWQDITIGHQAGLNTLHLATPPLQTAAIHKRLLGLEMPETEARLHKEDMHTAYAQLWNHSGCYIDTAEAVLNRLEAFFNTKKTHQCN